MILSRLPSFRFCSGQALRHGSGQVLLLALFALSGCSAMDTVQGWVGMKGGVEIAKLAEFSETARFQVRWHADIGDSGANLLQPALTRDAIYGASGKGVLTRLDRATRKQAWPI